MVLEMAGACWVLPEFNGSLGDVELIATMKKQVTDSLAQAEEDGDEGEANLHTGDVALGFCAVDKLGGEGALERLRARERCVRANAIGGMACRLSEGPFGM